MPGRECYHCKQWIAPGEAHHCWETTEAALTADLSEDLRDAWLRLRETAAGFGEQRIYASLNSIMFSRKACYCFVRPKPKYLEVCFFLGRTLTAPRIVRAAPASRVKVAHLVRVRHRDEVEAPLTEWIREAFDVSDELSGRAKGPSQPRVPGSGRRKATASTTRTTAAHPRRTARRRARSRARSRQG